MNALKWRHLSKTAAAFAAGAALLMATGVSAQSVKGGDIRGFYYGAYDEGMKKQPDLFMRKIKESGFNLCMIKARGNIGQENAEYLKSWLASAHKHGIDAFIFVDLFGVAESKEWLPKLKSRYVTAGKAYEKCFDLLDPELWQLQENRFMDIVKLASPETPIAGFMFDGEFYGSKDIHYSPEAEGYGSSLFDLFLKRKGIEPPANLPLEKRAEFIAGRSLREEYVQFCLDSTIERMKATVGKIRAAIPGCALGGYDCDGTSLFDKAIVRAMGSKETPFIDLCAATYGTGYSKEALDKAREKMKVRGGEETLVPSIWIKQFSPDAAASNLYFLATETSGGYWIYCLDELMPPEGSKFNGFPLDDYWKSLAGLNRELAKFKNDPNYKTELKLCSSAPAAFDPKLLAPYCGRSWTPAMEAKRLPKPPTFTFREITILCFYAKAGDKMEFDIQQKKYGKYQQHGEAVIYSPDGEYCQNFRIDMNQTVQAAWTAKKEGMYFLTLSVGRNGIRILKTSHHLAVIPPFDVYGSSDHALYLYGEGGEFSIECRPISRKVGRMVGVSGLKGNPVAEAKVDKPMKVQVGGKEGESFYKVALSPIPGPEEPEEFFFQGLSGKVAPFFGVSPEGCMKEVSK